LGVKPVDDTPHALLRLDLKATHPILGLTLKACHPLLRFVL
jgi:hypothetical protein